MSSKARRFASSAAKYFKFYRQALILDLSSIGFTIQDQSEPEILLKEYFIFQISNTFRYSKTGIFDQRADTVARQSMKGFIVVFPI